MAASSRVAWMNEPKNSASYIEGIASFLKFAVDNSGGDKLFSCPCTKCRNGKRKIKLDIVSEHLFMNGFDQSYTVWFVHGERITLVKEQSPIVDVINKSNGLYNHGYIPWMRKELEYVEGESTLKRLAGGPTFKAHTFNKYYVNGFVFTAGEYDVNKSTQNSGVSMKAITKYRASAKDRNYKEEETTYYGVVKKIIELDYTDFKSVVFYCDWVRVEDRTNGCKVDPNTNLILVNMEKFKGSDKEDDEPFILASQASQVFYCIDQLMPTWSAVLEAPKRLTKEVDALEDALLFHSPISENAMEEELLKDIDYEEDYEDDVESE